MRKEVDVEVVSEDSVEVTTVTYVDGCEIEDWTRYYRKGDYLFQIKERGRGHRQVTEYNPGNMGAATVLMGKSDTVLEHLVRLRIVPGDAKKCAS